MGNFLQTNEGVMVIIVAKYVTVKFRFLCEHLAKKV